MGAGRVTVAQYNAHTGEVIGQVLAVPPRKVSNGFNMGWLAVSLDELLRVAQAGLSRSALRVLCGVLSQVQYGNEVRVSQAELARLLGMSPTRVSQALGELERAEVVIRQSRTGRVVPIVVNPGFGWRGSGHSHRQALRGPVDQAVSSRRDAALAFNIGASA